MTIINIDPEKVLDNPYQPRSTYPRNKIDEIAYSIEQVGIIHVQRLGRSMTTTSWPRDI